MSLHAAPPHDFHAAIAAFRRDLLRAALLQAGGNRTRAAAALGLQRTYFLQLLRASGLGAEYPPASGRGVARRSA